MEQEERSSRCPTCGEEGLLLPQAVRGSHGARLYRCPRCTLEFLDLWSCPVLVRGLYQSEQVVYRSDIGAGAIKYDEYDRRLKEVMPYLGPGKRLLEVGAGQGIFLERVKPHVAEAHAVELSPVHAASLRQMGYQVWDRDLTELEPPAPYDVVCMYAVLEHIPNAVDFLRHLRSWLHEGSVVFIETPNLMEPLVSFYDVPAYRDFFYREYHLYNFTAVPPQALLAEAGFACRSWPVQVASLTNHFHWLHTGTKQASMNEMVNVSLPRPPLGSARRPAGTSSPS